MKDSLHDSFITKDNFLELDELIRRLDPVGIDEWIGLQLIKQEGKSFVPEFAYDETIDILQRLGEINEAVKCWIVPVKMRDLMLSWLKNISATQSFVNNHETGGIIQNFLDITTDFVNQDIVRYENDE
ncbi:MAG: hypothetical protein LBK73_04025 [Treponema sp.]|jgi:hypothetical protein|nr:hypothetical protein [Treponema sp.]